MVIPDNDNDNDNDNDDDDGDDVDGGVKGGGRELHAYNNHYEPQMLGPPDIRRAYRALCMREVTTIAREREEHREKGAGEGG